MHTPPTIDETHELPLTTILLVGCVVATCLAIASAGQTYLSMLTHGHSFARLFAWQLGGWLFWGLVCPLVMRLGAPLTVSVAPDTRRVVNAVAAAAALIPLHLCLTAALLAIVRPFLPLAEHSFGAAFRGQFTTVFPLDALVYVLLLVAGNAVGAQQRARRLATREARLELELARAQLDALRLEIHPHFLFNTLNSIAALIRIKDNPRALDMVIGLSELMRATVDGPKDHLVPLDNELDFLRRYVDLQRARFADRLVVDYRVADECRTLPVPTFLLQPLVENAIRHGASPLARPVRVEIGCRLHTGRLQLWVADDGAGLPQGFDLSTGSGTGLRNTHSRVTQIYGGNASFRVEPAAGGGTRVELLIPAAPPAAAIAASA